MHLWRSLEGPAAVTNRVSMREGEGARASGGSGGGAGEAEG